MMLVEGHSGSNLSLLRPGLGFLGIVDGDEAVRRRYKSLSMVVRLGRSIWIHIIERSSSRAVISRDYPMEPPSVTN